MCYFKDRSRLSWNHLNELSVILFRCKWYTCVTPLESSSCCFQALQFLILTFFWHMSGCGGLITWIQHSTAANRGNAHLSALVPVDKLHQGQESRMTFISPWEHFSIIWNLSISCYFLISFKTNQGTEGYVQHLTCQWLTRKCLLQPHRKNSRFLHPGVSLWPLEWQLPLVTPRRSHRPLMGKSHTQYKLFPMEMI